MPKKGKLVWIGDAVVETGFSRITHQVLDVLRHEWDVYVLGINYRGDPHDLPYPVYPAARAGRSEGLFGVQRTAQLVTEVKPDVVMILNDPWNVPEYVKKVGNANAIASVAVDGLNCRGGALSGLSACIFWTEFGLREAHRGGFSGQAAVIPLGVDLETYQPVDKVEARQRLGMPPALQSEDVFIVGNINRNQPRKRLDLTIRYFAEWVRGHQIGNAFLYLHVAPTGDQGYDIDQLCEYYGISSRVLAVQPNIGKGVPPHVLARTYNAFDVQVSTSQGEGFGLTALEGQACGVPQIAGDWAALGEILADSAMLVPCTTTATTPNMINAIGGIPDREEFIKCLHTVYTDEAIREVLRRRGLQNAAKDCYRWANIGAAYSRVIDQALDPSRLSRVGGHGEDQANRPGQDGAEAPRAGKEVS